MLPVVHASLTPIFRLTFFIMATNDTKTAETTQTGAAPTLTAQEALHFRVKQAQERRRQKRKRIHA